MFYSSDCVMIHKETVLSLCNIENRINYIRLINHKTGFTSYYLLYVILGKKFSITINHRGDDGVGLEC